MSTATEPAIQPQFTTIDGLRVRYADSGEEKPSQALLLSPWPESLLAFHLVWPQLAAQARLIAVDLPGFGQSERRESLLSPRDMGHFIVRLAEEFGLDSPHVVGPDVATAASLFGAADNPGRFRSLVVGSGGAVAAQLGGVLYEWVMAADIEPYREVDPRVIVAAGVTMIEGYTVPPAILEDYYTSYDGDRFVESMRYVRAYPEQLPILAEMLPTLQTPVQIIGGLWDFVVPPSNHRFLNRRLPNSNMDLIDSGHFAWEEAPDVYAAIVTRWWSQSYTVTA